MTRLFSGMLCFVAAAAIMLSHAPVEASDGMVEVSVRHNINGRSIGLSKDLPVVAYVSIDGKEVAAIPLVFKQRITAELPPGTYEIMVKLQDGGEIESMRLGPVDIPPGADVSILARLSSGKTPILDAKVR